jgi:hypothetical protein
MPDATAPRPTLSAWAASSWSPPSVRELLAAVAERAPGVLPDGFEAPRHGPVAKAIIKLFGV